MITTVVGSGGKTTLIHKLSEEYRACGKKVFVTTTTHMLVESDTLLTDDAQVIIQQLEDTGYAMAGISCGKKIRALSKETYDTVCTHADEVLVEADGSKGLPIKFPNDTEPVIPDNTEKIIVVCGLYALGKPARDVAFRLELVKQCLNITDDTIITPTHIQQLIRKGYIEKLVEFCPDIEIYVTHDDSINMRKIASLLEADRDVSLFKEDME